MTDIQTSYGIGERIEAAIKESGKKQREIAEAAGVTPQAVNRWIKTGTISTENLYVLSKETGYTVEWILTGKGPRKVEHAAGVPEVNLECLAEALAGLDVLEREFGHLEDQKKRAEFLWELYTINKELLDEGKAPMSPDNVIRIGKLFAAR